MIICEKYWEDASGDLLFFSSNTDVNAFLGEPTTFYFQREIFLFVKTR